MIAPPWPRGRGAWLLPGLLALLALLAARAPGRGAGTPLRDVLDATPRQLPTQPETQLLATVLPWSVWGGNRHGPALAAGHYWSGEPTAQQAVLTAGQSAAFYGQEALDFEVLADPRIGSFITDTPRGPGLGHGDPGVSKPVSLLAVSSPAGPGLLATGPGGVAHWAHGAWHRAPDHPAGAPVLLAQAARSPDDMHLLLFYPSTRLVQVARSTGARFQVHSLHASLPGSAAPRAVAGPGGLFVLWAGPSLMRVVAPAEVGPDTPVPLALEALPHAVEDVFLLSLTGVGPGATDAAIVLASDQLVLCHGIALAGCTEAEVLDLPRWTFGTGTRVLAPPALEHPGPAVHWLYLSNWVLGLLWHLELDPGTRAARHWTPVRVPRAASDHQAQMRVLGLRVGPDQAAWALAAPDAGPAFFLARDFRCDGPAGDPSIRCPGAPGADRGVGYACDAGRDLSPFLRPGHLCAGCAAGMEALPSDGPLPECAACPAPCQACVGGRCVLCPTGSPLRQLPDGSTACGAECPPGTAAGAGSRCLPEYPALHLDVSFRPMGAPGFPGPGRLLARTRLLVHDGQVYLSPAEAPASAMVVFLEEADARPVWLPAEDGPAGPWAPLPAGLFAMGPVRAFAEAGPLAAYCTEAGALWVRRYECAGPASPGTGACPLGLPPETMLQAAGCTELRPLGPGLVSVLWQDRAHVLRLGPAGQAELLPQAPGSARHPALARPTPRSDPWLLLLAGKPRIDGSPASSTDPDPRLSFLPVGLHLARDSRALLFDSAVAGPPQELPPWAEPVVVAVADPAAPAGPGAQEIFVSGIRPTGGAFLWEVAHLPAGAAPHWRTVGASASRELLGRLPAGALAGAVPDPGAQRVVALDLAPGPGAPAGDRFPAALALITHRAVGLAVVHCSPAGPPPGPGAAEWCRLLPARFFSLPVPAEHPRRVDLLPVPAPPGALARVRLLLPGLAEPLTLEVRQAPACPAGTYAPDCRGCDAGCRACRGPGPGDCTACAAFLPDAPDACLASCPEGLFPDPAGDGACRCHPSCARCEPAPAPGTGYRCVECPAGGLVPASPHRCAPCHDICRGCDAPGDPGQCRACARPDLVLLGGACEPACPSTHVPVPLQEGGPASELLCVPRMAGCLVPKPDGTCATCEAGYHAVAGVCRPCHVSCQSCQDAASCEVCQPGLVFLSAESATPSLCGGTCAPGEYVGAGRCAACDASCELCAGGPDRCQCLPGRVVQQRRVVPAVRRVLRHLRRWHGQPVHGLWPGAGAC
ncbi:hypothetical protein H696_06193 [Fonticula alba]|uniref:Serine/threonine protein kinase n=1 Tax=Fonticula alba TaxID=691883 RepID=A0A058YZG5_FONAL|nr:hypothetical protein H696_06193 [Fonticula alba]KCV67380.1 hypothetical protein H696_06193 [Fonticula alba]|eukprot:XP_009498212.1 hypothetical protein H696_06193 [Fonticula alba]